ncbi:MAG: molybdopterin molybdenumtransferase MoeA [Nevskiaceae bacterium]|nr:MAG: molybdopterin molybdenumtransferase MoeA [Nevskiaceae bacterium]TBR73374.1 MAG: molybdopterin molybdenumtransferase MoeA [Nevskiaceae bacterium]
MDTGTDHAQGGRGHGGPGPLRIKDALTRILATLQPCTKQERVTVRQALGRVLGADVVATGNVPAHTSSAMDGYAVRGADLPTAGTGTFHLAGSALAGHPFAGEVGAGECIRITTGGALPHGADTVVVQEEVTVHGARVHITAGHHTGQHVRRAGENVAAGATVLHAGRRLAPADLGILASLGITEVLVFRRLRVALFSTGDELRPPGEPLGAGEIYDSNRCTFHGALARLGAEVLDFGIVRDDPAALRMALQDAAAGADVVITSGGVSVGVADHVKAALAQVGRIGFWEVRMKPGRPIAFGRLDSGAAFFGLPGNPVSALVTYYRIVQPALDFLSGAEPRLPLALTVPTRDALGKARGRCEFHRGCLEADPTGTFSVRLAAPEGSGILRSMSLANCFIVLPEDSGPVAAGALVRVEPFAAFV